MKKTAEPPPCPDPERYLLVKTREGMFWRKKRGQGPKGARLNEKFRASAAGMAITAPAAKRVVEAIRPFLDGVQAGRLTVRISGRLRKQYNRIGKADYEYLAGFVIYCEEWYEAPLIKASYDYELGQIVWRSEQEKNRLKENTYIELILVSGECTGDKPLRVQRVVSNKSIEGNRCEEVLKLDVEEGPWFLVMNCYEGPANEAGQTGKKQWIGIVAAGGN